VRILIRNAEQEDARAIALVRVDSWRSTYRGLLPASFLNGLSYRDAEHHWNGILADPAQHGWAYVAEADGGQVVGFSLCGRTRDPLLPLEGELFALYLLQSHQRRGIGRQLFLAAVHQLRRAGLRGMLVWALETNQPARAFYERMGGTPAGQKNSVFGGMRVIQVAYRWDDLSQWDAESP